MEGSSSPSQQLGKYQLMATLGQGGMGTVYLALASGFGEFRKLLVVKELRQDLTRQKGFVSMFMDEAKLAARLAHPNVVQTFEASEVGDRYLLAMEYLDGQSLSALLDRLSQSPSMKLPLSMHIQILCEALSGLHYAHELLDYDGSSLQVVHRDVSPQNVFVTYHGQVKVVDFGVAKVANASAQTNPGVFVGKFSYAAPEQIMGRNVDARTDVFAVGVMLWQAIAGRQFSVQSATPAACRARADGMEPRIAEVVPNVDPVLAGICDRALAVDPDDRFESAQEFRSELQDYLKHAVVRVEASEIAQLMRDVFDTERRSLHAHIEQAMRRTGASQSSVDELAIFHRIDKERTAVADLSSLVDVSLERDDQKIRQCYAHSKITLVRSPSDQAPALLTPTFTHTPRRWLRAGTALSAVGLVGLGAAVFMHCNSSSSEPETHASSAIAAPIRPIAPELGVSPLPALDEHRQPVAEPVNGPVPDETNVFAEPPTRAEYPSTQRQPTAAVSNRYRSRGTPSRFTQSARDAPDPTPAHAPTPAPAPELTQRSVEEGTDLLPSRRAVSARIDRENPYR